MKTFVSGLVALLCAGLFQACSAAGSDTVGADPGEYIERASPVAYVAITAKGGSQVSFITYASWGNSCGGYSRAVIGNDGSLYSIQIIGKQPKGAVCLDVMTVFSAPVTVFLPSAGVYRFKFWRSDSTALDTTFSVK